MLYWTDVLDVPLALAIWFRGLILYLGIGGRVHDVVLEVM